MMITQTGHRNSSYNYGYYEPEFGAFLSAYRAPSVGMPAKRVQGGVYCSLSSHDTFVHANFSRYLDKYGVSD